MSFAYDVKEDILKVNTDASAKLIEFEAYLRLAGEFLLTRPVCLAFSSSNMHIIRHFISLLKQFYLTSDYELTSRTQQKLKKNTIYTCKIIGQAEAIIEDLNLIDVDSPKRTEILTEENLTRAYLRGAFIATGSVNSPTTSNYHLEIRSDKESEAKFIQRLMNEKYNMNASITKRRNTLIVYIKSHEKIVDFLRMIGANVAMNDFENEVIKRSLSAQTNRLINIDVANQQKTNKSAKEQIKWIKYLTYNYPLEKIDYKLRMVMKVRMEMPEASLSELVSFINEQYNENITKSGLNHRLRKLKEIAIDYQLRKKEG